MNRQMQESQLRGNLTKGNEAEGKEQDTCDHTDERDELQERRAQVLEKLRSADWRTLGLLRVCSHTLAPWRSPPPSPASGRKPGPRPATASASLATRCLQPRPRAGPVIGPTPWPPIPRLASRDPGESTGRVSLSCLRAETPPQR